MGIKEILNKFIGNSNKEVGRKVLPEEVELNSYLENERRDRLRALVHEKRKQHNNFMQYKSSYNYNKDVKQSFGNPKKRLCVNKKSNNLFWG